MDQVRNQVVHNKENIEKIQHTELRNIKEETNKRLDQLNETLDSGFKKLNETLDSASKSINEKIEYRREENSRKIDVVIKTGELHPNNRKKRILSTRKIRRRKQIKYVKKS